MVHLYPYQMGDRMKRLYVITALAVSGAAESEISPYAIKAYASAECPYEALFYFENHIRSDADVDYTFEPRIELLDQQNFDPEQHSFDNVRDAWLLGIVIIDQEYSSDHDFALSA